MLVIDVACIGSIIWAIERNHPWWVILFVFIMLSSYIGKNR